MARRNTKAELILNEARDRMEAAKVVMNDASAAMEKARAVWEAHCDAYDALKKALAPTPRKKAEKPSTSPTAPKEATPDKEAKCGVCYEVADHSNHDPTYLSSHKFDAPKPGRKSRKKLDAPAVIPSSDTGADGHALVAEMES